MSLSISPHCDDSEMELLELDPNIGLFDLSSDLSFEFLKPQPSSKLKPRDTLLCNDASIDHNFDDFSSSSMFAEDSCSLFEASELHLANEVAAGRVEVEHPNRTQPKDVPAPSAFTAIVIKKGERYLPHFKTKVLEYIRANRGKKTLKETAKEFGIHYTTISDWVKGKQRYKMDKSAKKKCRIETVKKSISKEKRATSRDASCIVIVKPTDPIADFVTWLSASNDNKLILHKDLLATKLEIVIESAGGLEGLRTQQKWFAQWIGRWKASHQPSNDSSTKETPTRKEPKVLYPIPFQNEVVRYAANHNQLAASQLFAIHRKCIYSWIQAQKNRVPEPDSIRSNNDLKLADSGSEDAIELPKAASVAIVVVQAELVPTSAKAEAAIEANAVSNSHCRDSGAIKVNIGEKNMTPSGLAKLGETECEIIIPDLLVATDASSSGSGLQTFSKSHLLRNRLEPSVNESDIKRRPTGNKGPNEKDLEIPTPNAIKVEISKFKLKSSKVPNILKKKKVNSREIAEVSDAPKQTKLLKVVPKEKKQREVGVSKRKIAVDRKLKEWFSELAKLGHKPSPQQVRKKASELYKDEGIENVNCSKTWYAKFCQRNELGLKHDQDPVIVEWILTQFDLNRTVTLNDVMDQALSVVHRTDSNFKGSTGWVIRFCKRNSGLLSVSPLPDKLLPRHMESKIADFRLSVQRLLKDKDILFGCLDEIALIPVSQSSALVAEKKLPLIRRTGFELSHGSMVISCLSTGRLLPFLIVLKGSPNSAELNGMSNEKVKIYYQQEGRVDHQILTHWITEIWTKAVTTEKKSLLLLDCFEPHCSSEFNEQCKLRDCQLQVIPPGCSSRLNPIEFLVKKHIQDSMTKLWLCKSTTCGTNGNKYHVPVLKDILHWATDVYSKLKHRKEEVEYSFRRTGWKD